MDVDHIPTEALMFQAGYLTIASVWSMPGRQEFTLRYPNLEVRASLNDCLLQAFSGSPSIPNGPNLSAAHRLNGLAMRSVHAVEVLSLIHI